MSNTFISLPVTKSGRWSFWLTVAFAVMFSVNSIVYTPYSGDASWQHAILSFSGITMVSLGLAAGILGLISLIREHERSWLVWMSIWPGLIVIFLVVSVFLFPD